MRLLDTSGTKADRKTLKSTASVLGLAAGAIGWSSLAQAAGDESGPQTLLLPDHYRLFEDGVVIFQLKGGEELSLNPDQYLILQDGLLLVTDELAQASIQSLPVMGSIRAQLTSELQPVRSPDGSVVLASDASPLWSGDGPAPRLFEDVDIERFELAQNEQDTQSEASPSDLPGIAGTGLSFAALGLVSGVFQSAPDEIAEVDAEVVTPSAPQSTIILSTTDPGTGLTPISNTLTESRFYNQTYLFYSSFDSGQVPYASSFTATTNDVNNDDPAGLNGDVSAGVTLNGLNTYDRLYSNVVIAGFSDGITDPRLDGDTWTIVLTVTDGTLTEIETITVEFDL